MTEPTHADGAALARFRRSMQIGYSQWRDGEGYDLAALGALTETERRVIEPELIARATQDWRDVQALAALATPAADAALRDAFGRGGLAIEFAILRYAPHLADVADRVRTMVQAIESAELDDGLSEAIDEAATFHPPPVLYALQRALLDRSGDVATLVAGLLFHIHGKADEPFDWEQRPFFLRFHTEDPALRRAAYGELCAVLGIGPLPHS